MRLIRSRKMKEEAQVDLTSMLDIVFIMLIFFIVTSTFVQQTGVEINRPQATNSQAQSDVSIVVAITKSNDIYLNQQRVDSERLELSLTQLAREFANTSLMIEADEHAYNGTVVKVMDAAQGAGIENVAVATAQVP